MMDERQTNYTIMEGYEIPSQGKIYDQEVNPHIELRSMTARDEMKRLSPSTTPLKTLSDIIEGCCIEKPSIPIYDMCLGDYEFLLHKLRIVTYGEKYKMINRCPYCMHAFEGELNLGTLPLKEFDEETYNSYKIFELPKSKKIVKLKNQTPRLSEEIEAAAKDKKRRFKGVDMDFDLLCKLTYSIDTIDDVKYNQIDTEKIISNLSAIDMQKILNQIDHLTVAVGLDTTFETTCEKCGEDFTSFFRYGPEFFRPTNI